MKIKNQTYSVVASDFSFCVDGDFEVQIALDQPCFANCNLVVSGLVDSDDGLFPVLSSFSILTSKGTEKTVVPDPALEQKIESDVSEIFTKDFERYCEQMCDEIAFNRFEGRIYD